MTAEISTMYHYVLFSVINTYSLTASTCCVVNLVSGLNILNILENLLQMSCPTENEIPANNRMQEPWEPSLKRQYNTSVLLCPLYRLTDQNRAFTSRSNADDGQSRKRLRVLGGVQCQLNPQRRTLHNLKDATDNIALLEPEAVNVTLGESLPLNRTSTEPYQVCLWRAREQEHIVSNHFGEKSLMLRRQGYEKAGHCLGHFIMDNLVLLVVIDQVLRER